MADQDLRRTLLELRRELAEVGDVGDDVEALLAGIRGDIDAVLERSGPHTLGDRLGEAVTSFEASHPRLASAMAAVLDQLANIGV